MSFMFSFINGLSLLYQRMPRWPSLIAGFLWIVTSSVTLNPISAVRTYDDKRLSELRSEVKSMFYHAYDNYMKHAYPFDELRPLSCDGVDTWGSYSLTLIDTLDTLAVMGNYSEFRRVAQLIIDNAHFDLNINVSVFETNIRIIGGLLLAHLLSQKAGMELEAGWPCNGPLLRKAEKVARKLLPAFDTATGMPYGTVNLRNGVPPNETPVTCTAGVGTFIIEFGALSRLTGDPLYEKVALRALHSLYSKRSAIDLVGNHIDTETGKWTAIDSGIGAGVDSYFEYLVKGAILFQRPELMQMFHVSFDAIEKYLGKGGWYVWATMGQGHVSTTTFQSLEAYWPGLLSLVGDFKTGIKAITNYHRILKQYGGLPELYNILQGKATHQREGYPLRPELVESAMYLYRATKDPYMLEIGEDILHSIDHVAKTECGFATIRDVTTLTLEDRMESFFLAETLKYLYLLFDPTNFIHNDGDDFTVIQNPMGQTCTLYAGGYIFNTEAHPIDPSALYCCSGIKESELHEEIRVIDEFGNDGKTMTTKFKGREKGSVIAKRKKEELIFNRKAARKQQKVQQANSQQVQTGKDEEEEEIMIVKVSDTYKISSSSIGSSASTRSAMVNPLLSLAPKKGSRSSKDEEVCETASSVYDSQSQFVGGRQQLSLEQLLERAGASSKTLSSIAKVTEGDPEHESTSSVLEKLLKKLFDEQQVESSKLPKAKLVSIGEISDEPIDANKPGLTFLSSEGMQKLFQSFEAKTKSGSTKNNNGIITSTGTGTIKTVSKSTSTVETINRIKQFKPTGPGKRQRQEPDFDLLFGSTPGKSLSFYFTLKWLRSFPDLIMQLIPSERFDLEAFYSRMSDQFSTERFAKDYNLTVEWLNDHEVLRCPTIKLIDRFAFFRPSLDD